MKNRFVLMIGLAALTIALGISPSASAGTTIQKISGDEYSISSEFIDFLYRGDATICIKSFKTTETKRVVFDEIRFDYFTPIQEPYVDPSGLKVVAEGQDARATIHSNPATTINFETYIQNQASFKFSSDVGAINLGRSLYIGNEEMRAEIILMGDGNISKTSINQFSFFMEGNSNLIFRNNFVDLEPIGDKIAQDVIAGELFISKDQYSVVEDLVDYLPVSMKTTSSGNDRLEVEVEGEFEEGKVLIFDISKDVLSLEKDDLVVKLDEKDVQSTAKDEVLKGSGEEPKFAVVENEKYLQVHLYVPSFSTHTVTFGRFTPQTAVYGEVMIGLGIAAVISVISAIYIFRRKKEF